MNQRTLQRKTQSKILWCHAELTNNTLQRFLNYTYRADHLYQSSVLARRTLIIQSDATNQQQSLQDQHRRQPYHPTHYQHRLIGYTDADSYSDWSSVKANSSSQIGSTTIPIASAISLDDYSTTTLVRMLIRQWSHSLQHCYQDRQQHMHSTVDTIRLVEMQRIRFATTSQLWQVSD